MAAAFLSLLGSGCWDVFAVKETQNTPIIFERLKKTAASGAIDDEPFVTSTRVIIPAPPLKPGETASASGNVAVSSPAPNQQLANPFVILGRARVFENMVLFRIRDKHGAELAAGRATVDARDMGVFGQFRVRAFLRNAPQAISGRVEVFSLSPRDGSEQDLASVPVKLNTEAAFVKIFFSNVLKDPQAKACEVVYPVRRRLAKTTNPAEAALLELLDGPSAAEQAMGSRTALMPGARLLSVKLDSDVATADFSRELAFGLTEACMRQAMRSQIEQTLKQFPNVKVVKIRIEGEDANDLLKP